MTEITHPETDQSSEASDIKLPIVVMLMAILLSPVIFDLVTPLINRLAEGK